MESPKTITIQLPTARPKKELLRLAVIEARKAVKEAYPELWEKRGRKSDARPVMARLWRIYRKLKPGQTLSQGKLVQQIREQWGNGVVPTKETVTKVVKQLRLLLVLHEPRIIDVDGQKRIALERPTPMEARWLDKHASALMKARENMTGVLDAADMNPVGPPQQVKIRFGRIAVDASIQEFVPSDETMKQISLALKNLGAEIAPFGPGSEENPPKG